jgi:hypothetical protein
LAAEYLSQGSYLTDKAATGEFQTRAGMFVDAATLLSTAFFESLWPQAP